MRTAKELEREADTLEEGSAQRRETGCKFPQEYSEICELSGETGESHDEWLVESNTLGAPSPKRRRSTMVGMTHLRV